MATIKDRHARGQEETVFDLPPVVSGRMCESETGNMLAEEPGAKQHADKKHKPGGAIEILAMLGIQIKQSGKATGRVFSC